MCMMKLFSVRTEGWDVSSTWWRMLENWVCWKYFMYLLYLCLWWQFKVAYKPWWHSHQTWGSVIFTYIYCLGLLKPVMLAFILIAVECIWVFLNTVQMGEGEGQEGNATETLKSLQNFKSSFELWKNIASEGWMAFQTVNLTQTCTNNGGQNWNNFRQWKRKLS